MLPRQGQGASPAIEDAAALVRALELYGAGEDVTAIDGAFSRQQSNGWPVLKRAEA